MLTPQGPGYDSSPLHDKHTLDVTSEKVWKLYFFTPVADALLLHGIDVEKERIAIA